MREMQRKSRSVLAVFAGLLLVGMFLVPAASAESEQTDSIGVCSIDIENAGSLLVDETGGMSCYANGETITEDYVPGQSYKIIVNYEYIETGDVVLQTANFVMKDKRGVVVDSDSIYDAPFIENDWVGTLETTISPDGPGNWQWDIYCSGGDESASDTIDFTLK